MKRLIALWIALIMILAGTAAAAEDSAKEKPEVFSYDYDLRFQLDTETFPRRERRHAQGYADLLNALEFRGNFTWIPKTKSMDLRLEIVSAANPDVSLSLHLFGLPEHWLRVESPLLGEEAICFQPDGLMAFAQRAWETFQLPLVKGMILIPRTITDAFDCLLDAWERETGDLRSTDALPHETLEKIAEEWREALETDEDLRKWILAVTEPLADGELVRKEIMMIPDMMLAAFGKEDLVVDSNNRKLILCDPDEKPIYLRTDSAHAHQRVLFPKETELDYIPALTYEEEEKDGFMTVGLAASLSRSASADAQLPDSIMHMEIRGERIPESFPSDSDFTASISMGGCMLTECSFLLNGKTGENGRVHLELSMADTPGSSPALICDGTVTPARWEGPTEYFIADIHTEYNLFALGDQSLSALVHGAEKGFVGEIIDFLYEMPASACQSILDDLERYGLLQTIMQQ